METWICSQWVRGTGESSALRSVSGVVIAESARMGLSWRTQCSGGLLWRCSHLPPAP